MNSRSNYFWAPVRFPSLNDLMYQARRQRMKAKTDPGKAAVVFAREADFEPWGSHWTFLLVEPDRRRDADNVIGGAQKVIFDCLVRGKMLGNDTRAMVSQIRSHLCVDEPYGALVIAAEETYDRDHMLALWGELKERNRR